MHYLYYVATKKEKGVEKKSSEIQEEVLEVLESNGFAGDGGLWSHSKSDWYVIGGRWSGNLQALKLGDFDDKVREIINKNKAQESNYITQQDIDKNSEEIQKLWIELGGVGINSWQRDQYVMKGLYEDDTMLLDEKLFEALSKQTTGESEVEVALIDDGCAEEEIMMKDFLALANVVDSYYLTVIDYHN